MDWEKTSVTKDEYYHMLSMISMKEDCESLFSISMSNPKHSVLILSLLPYYALFCKETLNYANSHGYNLSIESPFDLSKMRASLKNFSERYGKSIRKITNLDAVHDELFRKKLRFKFLQFFNIHKNLGIYYYNNHPVSNTQLINFCFDHDIMTDSSNTRNELEELGNVIGKTINSVKEGLNNFIPDLKVNSSVINSFNYKDINDNKKRLFNIESENQKGDSLYLLHIISMINFACYTIEDLIEDSYWKTKVQYISYYYAYNNLSKVVKRIKNEKAREAINNTICDDKLISSEFRSCMMHYSFINKGKYLINDSYLDVYRPMFGLVESCFDNMDFNSFQIELKKRLRILSSGLEELFLL